MTIQNINAYEEHAFRTRFEQTALYQKLQTDFDIITFDKHWQGHATPRQNAGLSIFSAVPFYYLEFLTQNKPTAIYDIGCGWNIFKKYIPEVVGIGGELADSEYFYGDIHGYVDDDFVLKHRDFFESAFSINALHFVPLSNIQQIVREFYTMLKPGATGWLALNTFVMLDRDKQVFHNKQVSDIDSYIRVALGEFEIDYKVFDVDLAVLNEFMNGNIRLVMRKRENNA